MAFTFDGANKLIILTTGTTSFTAGEIYSRWKEWVQLTDNSKYEIAFTSVAGDPISDTQNISPYIFLNTSAGWRLRAQEADHTLSIEGNLYSVNPSLPLFTPTLADFTVTVTIDRSAASITTTVGASELEEATIQSAMTAQGYTSARATKIDNLDAVISSLEGEGLTLMQATMLLEMYKLLGLDPTKPLVVTPTTRKVPANGADISQTITEVGDDVTVQRV